MAISNMLVKPLSSTWPLWSMSVRLTCAIYLLDMVRAEDAATCYDGGTLALSIIVALILAASCTALAYFLWSKWKARKGQHLILETDPEKGEYAFDNPGFRDAGLTPTAKSNSKLENNLKTKWSQWSPLGALTLKNEKKRTVDDSDIENQVKNVSLRSHDFTGLGFNICGNMKDGIFVKDIQHRGPAFESKKLNVGDRIQSVLISFEHMVYEDALAILSYASPYEIVVSAKNGKTYTPGEVGHPQHPIYRSVSSTDLSQEHKKRQFDDSNELEIKARPKQLDGGSVVKNELQQNNENKVHKFGVQVLPPLGNPTKAQNTNNVNHESEHIKNGKSERKTVVQVDRSIDEVDRKPPPVKKREKNQIPQTNHQAPVITHNDEPFQRNNSDIRRDENDIPLEVPCVMLNAAVAARKNRKSLDEEDLRSPKKKGKAPAPPEAGSIDNETGVESDGKDYHSDSDGETDNAGKDQSSANTIELNASDITIHQSEDGSDEKRKTASTGDLSKIQKARKTSTGTLERAQSLDITDTGIPSLTSKKRKGDDFETKTSSYESLYGSALVDREPRLSLILDGLNTCQRSRLKKSTEWGNLEDAILNVDKHTAGTQEASDASKSFDFASKSPELDALVNKINEIKQETIDIINEQSKNIREVEISKRQISHIIHHLDKTVSDEIEPLMLNQSETAISIEDEQMPQIVRAIDSCVLDSSSPKKGEKNTIWPFELSTQQCNKEIVEEKDSTNIRNIPISNNGNESNDGSDCTMETLSENTIMRTELPIIVDLNEKNHINAKLTEMIAEAERIAAFLIAERSDGLRYSPEMTKLDDDVNVPDDLKVRFNAANVSNITINHQSTDAFTDAINHPESHKCISVTTPDLIKNLAITEAIYDLNNEVTIEGPTSLTLQVAGGCSPTTISSQCDDTKVEIKQQNGDIKTMEVTAEDDVDESQQSLSYITEIQVLTPAKTNISEIQVGSKSAHEKLDSDFEQYIKNFESNIKTFESNIHHFEANIQSVAETIKSPEAGIANNQGSTNINSVTVDKADGENELKKVQDIVEEQLKKLPEMRFTTSSYEKQIKLPEKRLSQIDILRSNFEKGSSPPRNARSETSPPKSRIPVLNKTPPMSPERRDSRNMDTEQDKDILEIMSSKYPHKNRNVTVTSIRSNSRIPSGLPAYGSRPPIAPKKNESVEDLGNSNGNAGNVETFRQWVVFNPNDQAVTNVAVTEGYKHENRK